MQAQYIERRHKTKFLFTRSSMEKPFTVSVPVITYGVSLFGNVVLNVDII